MTSWTLVTGGAKNLGAGICLALAKQGHNILVHYKSSAAEAEALVNACRDLGVKADRIYGDFSTQENLDFFITNLIQEFPDIKNLINNVGNYLVKPLMETSTDEMKDLFQTNVYTPFTLIKALLPLIKSQGGGSVVNIGNSGLSLKANIRTPAYMLSKTCLLHLTKTLAKELALDGVTVNMVSPGILSFSVDLLGEIPMKRFAEIADVTNAISFFLEDKNRYVTGQNIEVAGGFML